MHGKMRIEDIRVRRFRRVAEKNRCIVDDDADGAEGGRRLSMSAAVGADCVRSA